MIQAVPLNCSLTSFLGEPISSAQGPKSATSPRKSGSIFCSGSRNNAHLPKLEPFTGTKFDRFVKEPPLIQKSEDQIADYCVTLEGDEAYSCWEAYFELKDLENEAPKEEVERLIMEANGVKSLIKYVHGVSAIHKLKKESTDSPKQAHVEQVKPAESSQCPIPDGLPKSLKELKEEEDARMPDSAFTRLLRAKGKFPAWYTPAPDHETD